MKHAFSLVELSIVLVILGLLTGGILTGQNLIRAAELRAVTTEFSQYQTAVMTFRDKYFAYPGDMRNATDFWGAMTNCGAASPSGTGTQTCNGDGDGHIETGTTSQTGENFGFWQQLTNAGLIEGSYTGIAGSGNASDAELGENIPTSKLGNAGWHLRDDAHSSNGLFTDGDYNNSFIFGANSDTQYTWEAAISPQEAWNIDKKVDDGLPQQGKLWAVRYGPCTTLSGGTDFALTNGEYDLAFEGDQCALAFIDAF